MCETYKTTAMFEMIKERYGMNMNSDELGELRTAINDIPTAADTIRAVHMDNSVEPMSVFTPYRKKGMDT